VYQKAILFDVNFRKSALEKSVHGKEFDFVFELKRPHFTVEIKVGKQVLKTVNVKTGKMQVYNRVLKNRVSIHMIE